MINNRQNGRRRGRGGQRPGNGNPGRPDNGSRIDNRARGNASQLHEKYKTLATEAQRQGDRVNTEYYLQFADHYFRVLNENRARFDEQPRRQAGAYDDDDDGDGEDYGAEGEPARADQYQPRGDERPRYEDRPRQPQDDRPRQGQDDRQRDERPRQGQDERPRHDERARQGGGNGQEERPRRDEQRPRDDRPRDEQRRPRFANGQANGAEPVRNGAPASLTAAPRDDVITPPRPATDEASTVRAADMDAPEPRRRGRPRRERPDEAAAPEVFDADRLPPSLSVSASAEPDAGEPADKPRRRRRAPTAVEAPPAS